MNKFKMKTKVARYFLQSTALLIAFMLLVTAVTKAQTASGTVISNQAAASYSDGTNTYTTVSNTVTVTVAKVSGLAITPDAGTGVSVVPGQTNVVYSFRVTNTGNFDDQVRFLANGASVKATNATVTKIVIDNGSTAGVIDSGDTVIYSSALGSNPELTPSIARNNYIDVLVAVDVSSNVAAGSTVNVQLGDAATGSPTYDNQPANTSANELRTVDTTSVNGLREARGDYNSTVIKDALLQLSVVHTPGPVSLSTDPVNSPTVLNYAWKVCNTNGASPAQTTTLTNAPAGSNTGIFIIAPIPANTALSATQTVAFPAGTLYTTSPLTTAPTAAVWTTSAPSNLATVTRVAFNAGSTLAVGGCSSSFSMDVKVTTTNASTNIYEIGDVFAKNTAGSQITDQSGDTVDNKGDGNADFDEPIAGGTVSTTQGFQVVTTFAKSGSVFIGPSAAPEATGPTGSTNDDYTNRSVATAVITGYGPTSTTSAASTITYTNTVKNKGNANDTVALTVPNIPTGFTVRISTDNGVTWTTMTTSNSVSLTVNYNSTADIKVEVTAPTGKAVLTGFDVPVVVTSGNTSSNNNTTIDRLYTGALKLTKVVKVCDSAGANCAAENATTNPAIPTKVLEYTITYENVTSTNGTGSGSLGLSISSLAITENGETAPNNWAATTTHLASPAPSDSNNGTIVVSNSANYTNGKLVDTVGSLVPGATGTFTFKRTIK